MIKSECSCGNIVNVPDEFAGRTGTCRKCGRSMAISGKKPTPMGRGIPGEVFADVPVPVPAPVPVPISASVPVSVQPSTVACPFCSEQILQAAKKCKHCSEILDPVLRAKMTPAAHAAPIIISAPQAVSAPTTVVIQNTIMGMVESVPKRKSGCGCLFILFLIYMLYLSVTQRPPIAPKPEPVIPPVSVPVVVLPRSEAPLEAPTPIPVEVPTPVPAGWAVGDLGTLIGLNDGQDVNISKTRPDTLNLIEAERRLRSKEGLHPGEMRYSMFTSKRITLHAKGSPIRVVEIAGNLCKIEVLGEPRSKVMGNGWVPTSWLAR